jgi:hypothetical protein
MSDMTAAAVLATALWLGIGYGILAAGPPPPGPHRALSSSDKVASHSRIVPASHPVRIAKP